MSAENPLESRDPGQGKPWYVENKEQEEKEKLRSEIVVYAIDFTQTHEDILNKQGFPTGSRKLENPSKTTIYYWEGKLHKTGKDYVKSQNSRDNLEWLAENLADNIRMHQNPEAQKSGNPSYSLSYQPSEKIRARIVSEYHNEGIARGLTPEEQEEFIEALRNANEKK